MYDSNATVTSRHTEPTRAGTTLTASLDVISTLFRVQVRLQKAQFLLAPRSRDISAKAQFRPPPPPVHAGPQGWPHDLLHPPKRPQRCPRRCRCCRRRPVTRRPRPRRPARPRVALVRNRLTLPSGIATGDVTTDSGVLWSRASGPGRLVANLLAVDDGRVPAPRRPRLPARAARDRRQRGHRLHLPDQRRAPPGRHPLRAHHALRGRRRQRRRNRAAAPSAPRPARSQQRLLSSGRAAPRAELRLDRRHRRPGLGHQRGDRRHARLRGHARHQAGLLHPLRRHHLRRRPHRRPGHRARRADLAQPRHRGGVQGGRDPQRVPRPAPLQPDGHATSAPCTPRCR